MPTTGFDSRLLSNNPLTTLNRRGRSCWNKFDNREKYGRQFPFVFIACIIDVGYNFQLNYNDGHKFSGEKRYDIGVSKIKNTRGPTFFVVFCLQRLT